MSKYLDIAAVSTRSVAIAFENPLGFQIPRWPGGIDSPTSDATSRRRRSRIRAFKHDRRSERAAGVCALPCRALVCGASNLLQAIFKSTEIPITCWASLIKRTYDKQW